jgi:hypothetical protein
MLKADNAYVHKVFYLELCIIFRTWTFTKKIKNQTEMLLRKIRLKSYLIVSHLSVIHLFSWLNRKDRESDRVSNLNIYNGLHNLNAINTIIIFRAELTVMLLRNELDILTRRLNSTSQYNCLDGNYSLVTSFEIQ